MATTDNLGIELINGSDYISPEPINEGFRKIDALGVDYVVAQGTSGEWWYRKWASGRAECGIYDKGFGETALSAWGNAWKSDALAIGAYPTGAITWASVPSAVVNFSYDDSGAFGAIVMPLATTKAKALTTAPSVALVRPDAAITFAGPHLSVYVCGTYK